MIIKKLPEDQQDEELFEEFIDKGGKTKGDNEIKREKVIRFSLRVPESLVNEIDHCRKKKFGVSRNLWIVEAIENYIKNN